MTTETDFNLTPDQLDYIRAAHARWRMDEAGPMMLEALRDAELALCYPKESTRMTALASVRAAIAAAE